VSLVPEFVHLHVHSEYSLRESTLRVDTLVRMAAEMGMPAVAITDTDALYGAIQFYCAAKEAGVKPIIGVQLRVAPWESGVDSQRAEGDGRPLRVRPGGKADAPLDTAVLLAESLAGYRNLVKLVTKARARERLPYVCLDELAAHQDGVIALVGGGESAILQGFSAGDAAAAEAWLGRWQSLWRADSLYVDVQDHHLAKERRGLPALIRAARSRNLPLVATNDVHYATPDDAPVQRVLAAIDGSGHGLEGDRYHFASPEEMARRFAKLPEAMQSTLAVAERCQLELPLGQLRLPRYPTPNGEPPAAVLRRAAEAGVRQRYGQITPELRERLEYELDIIERLGYADYFLVVADFIRYAHRQGISTGPGRGSAAGSLVAYALRITDVDPIANKLLFERFLNPERVSWPDIDTDFEFERRGEVIAYVVQRYGADRVAQIGTFGTLAAKAAIRDAGRALGESPDIVDRLARRVPSQPGMTLAQALAQVPALREMLESDPAAQRVWRTAEALEGLPRHTSVHAAGVVISPDPLTDLVPLQPGTDGVPVTQYAMEDIERLGLVKMDFLGLRTLTLIDTVIDSVARRGGGRVDWRKVPTDDPATYEMLSRGETDGCFQLESTGMRRVLRELRPTGLDDLVAVISLYRPGPMEHIPTFIAAKHGRVPIHYPHPDLEPILKDTYGVIVYQEQIMQIAARMAGFTLGEADLLRRAVSKKQREVLDAERARFVAGCVARGYAEETAHEVYDLIVRFADYGFNRSHAAAYAILAFRTAYLRAHHLPDFLAALLTMAMGSAEKTAEYIRDARRHGIRVLPPSVQESEAVYTALSDHEIRTGLLAVRNVGRAAVDAILEARREGPFRSLVDFLQRVNPRVVNRKAVESLLAAGALAPFLPDNVSPRAARHILEEAYQSAEWQRHAGSAGLGLAEDGPQALFIRFGPEAQADGGLARLREVLASQPGTTPVALYDPVRRKLRLLPEHCRVEVTPELISALEELVGLGNARMGRLPSGIQASPAPAADVSAGEE
jgi:DNA polymerase-3 subunit alpha